MNQILREWILGEIRGGASLVAIAALLDVGTTVVQDAIVDWILEQIVEGESQKDIAASLNRSAGCVSLWLMRDEATIIRSDHARKCSAEAWLDKGLQAVYDAMSDPAYKGTGTDSGAARAYAQECARRAAIRNPAYREKTDTKLELTGPGGGPIRSIAATVTPEQAAATYKELLG